MCVYLPGASLSSSSLVSFIVSSIKSSVDVDFCKIFGRLALNLSKMAPTSSAGFGVVGGSFLGLDDDEEEEELCRTGGGGGLFRASLRLDAAVVSGGGITWRYAALRYYNTVQYSAAALLYTTTVQCRGTAIHQYRTGQYPALRRKVREAQNNF